MFIVGKSFFEVCSFGPSKPGTAQPQLVILLLNDVTGIYDSNCIIAFDQHFKTVLSIIACIWFNILVVISWSVICFTLSVKQNNSVSGWQVATNNWKPFANIKPQYSAKLYQSENYVWIWIDFLYLFCHFKHNMFFSQQYIVHLRRRSWKTSPSLGHCHFLLIVLCIAARSLFDGKQKEQQCKQVCYNWLFCACFSCSSPFLQFSETSILQKS